VGRVYRDTYVDLYKTERVRIVLLGHEQSPVAHFKNLREGIDRGHRESSPSGI